MAIGLINSPASWLQGTVVAPSFLQNVTDNINGWIAGTGGSFKGLQIDATGGVATTAGAGHLFFQGAVPGFTLGTGAGTGAAGGLSNSTDARGVISITTGTTPSTSSTIITVNFSVNYPSAPGSVIVTPLSATAAALSGNQQVRASGSTTAGFPLVSGSTALAASTSYDWWFVVLG